MVIETSLAKRCPEWKRERKAFRKTLARYEAQRATSDVIAGEAMTLLGLACDLLSERTGHSRERVLEILHTASCRD